MKICSICKVRIVYLTKSLMQSNKSTIIVVPSRAAKQQVLKQLCRYCCSLDERRIQVFALSLPWVNSPHTLRETTDTSPAPKMVLC